MVNKIYSGDCLLVMRHDILERGIKVDLIYLDPPFFTGKVQKGTWQPGAMEVSYEDSKKFWGTKGATGAPTWIKEVGVKRPAFASYLEYMRKRLELCERIMKNTGSIYLHCDYRASHYLKMVMDGVFSSKNFKNEIVWCYSGGGIPRKDFPRKHDTIFRYTKSGNYTFHVEYKPYAENTQQVGIHSTYSGDTREDIKIDLERGTPVTDWWIDVKTVTGWNPEVLGYPTQKPLALLERIIKASSNEGDLVMDPFCGCGTAIAAAHKLNRNWIGIDIENDACTVIRKRFEDEFGIKPEIHLREVEEVKKLNPKQFEAWVNEFYQAKKPRPDRGVDGITEKGISIQTKTGIVKYNVVSQFLNDMRYHPDVPKPVKHGIIVSQNGFDESAIARVFQIKEKDKIDIKLVTPEDLL